MLHTVSSGGFPPATHKVTGRPGALRSQVCTKEKSFVSVHVKTVRSTHSHKSQTDRVLGMLTYQSTLKNRTSQNIILGQAYYYYLMKTSSESLPRVRSYARHFHISDFI